MHYLFTKEVYCSFIFYYYSLLVIKDALSELPATIDRVVKESITDSVPVSDLSYAADTATPVVPFIPVSAQTDNLWTHELKYARISENRGEFNSQTESDFFKLSSILSHLREKTTYVWNHLGVLVGKTPMSPDSELFLLSSTRSSIARSFYPSFTSWKLIVLLFIFRNSCLPQSRLQCVNSSNWDLLFQQETKFQKKIEKT